MRITSKGQVTIPANLRERFGLLPETEVVFEATDQGVLLSKASGPRTRGRAIVEHLTGRATRKLSTDEIMAMTRGE
jgi:AbrB family looped-hinge helix DNA binding protein